jgi:predicted aconitase with swiveling domain
MKSNNPINFLGAVDKKTGIIRDTNHDMYQKCLKNTILVFPHGIGSSVGAYTIYSLKSNGTAPAAMICSKADLSVASGCAIADIPLVIATQDQLDSLKDGEEIMIDTDAEKIL